MTGPIKYAFLDLETTGLDPKKDSILEIAIALTDDYGNIVTSRQEILHFKRQSYHVIEGVVQEMHSVNGLWKDCEDPNNACARTAERRMLAFLYDVIEKGAVHLAGNSIHFDLRFLIEHMPELAKFFHYRMLDVTSLRLFFDDRGVPAPQKAAPHRAMADVHASIAQLRHYIYQDLMGRAR